MSDDLFSSKSLKRKLSRCCVPSCKETTNLDISFHSFPLDEAMKKQWLDILMLEKVDEGMKVCGAHFNNNDFFSTYGAFKTHKLNVKRLKRTAIPTLQLPVKDDEPTTTNGSIVGDVEQSELVITSVSSRATLGKSEMENYSIGSYVCTTCSLIENSEAAFLEHLNSHVKEENHNEGDGALIKVEPEIFSSPKEDSDDDYYPMADVDSLNGVTYHPNDADGGIVEDGNFDAPVLYSLPESECDEVDPLNPDADKSSNDLLDKCMNGTMLTESVLTERKNEEISLSIQAVRNSLWTNRKRFSFVCYPPFTKEKLLHGDMAKLFMSALPKFTCLHCPFRGFNGRLFHAHLQIHSEGKQFACISCQSYFDSKEALIDKHTSGSSCGTIKVLNFLLRCDECWEFFSLEQDLTNHMLYENCTRKIKAPCDMCGQEVIKYHMESHLKEHKTRVNDPSTEELEKAINQSTNTFCRLMHEVTSMEQVAVINNSLKTLEARIIAMNQLKRASAFDSREKVDVRKKIEPQRRFSLKKKMKKTNAAIFKHSAGDTLSVAIQNILTAENVPT